MKKIFFAAALALILALAGCSGNGGNEADASLAPDPARAETAADTAAGSDKSAHGSADAGEISVDLTLNGDLFSDMGLLYSETSAKRGKVIKAHTPEGRASYSFENGYGEYIYSIGSMKMCFWEYGGTDPVPEHFATPGHDDPCLGIAYVKIGDLFCGEIDRVPVSDLGSIADFEYIGTRERGGAETVREWVSEFRYSSVPAFRVIIMHDDHDFIDSAAEASVNRY